MIVRALDAANDWEYGKGRNNYKSANSAIAQNIQTRLSSFLGDCFFDINAGLDWFSYNSSKNQIALNLAVSAAIINTEGVVSVNELSVSFNSRTRRIQIIYSANTIYTGVGNNPNQVVTGSPIFLLTQDGIILTTEDGDRLEIE